MFYNILCLAHHTGDAALQKWNSPAKLQPPEKEPDELSSKQCDK